LPSTTKLATRFAPWSHCPKQRAFAIAGLNGQYGLTEAHRAIAEALEAGVAQRAAVAQLGDVFAAAGLTGKKHHLNIVFRNNVLGSYAAGRWAQLRRVAKRRPYWRYRTVGDERVRPAHRAMNGKIFAADDPIWNSWYPPNGHQCRCSVESLSSSDMEREKLEPETSDPKVKPDRGWEASPGTDDKGRKAAAEALRKARGLRVLQPPKLAKRGSRPYTDAGDLGPGDLERKRDVLRSAAGLTQKEIAKRLADGRFATEKIGKLGAGVVEARVPVPSQFVDAIEQLLAGVSSNPETAHLAQQLRLTPRAWFDPRVASAARMEVIALEGGSGGTDLVAVISGKAADVEALAEIAARAQAGSPGAVRRAVDVTDAIIRGAKEVPPGWRRAVLNMKEGEARLTRAPLRGYLDEEVLITDAKWKDIP
jgi:SPP1 gp7 family putative phage head morphogenesis protein